MKSNEIINNSNDILKKLNTQGIFDGIKIKQDNRRKIVALSDLKNREIIINTKHKYLKNLDAVRLIVLHELGHFVHINNDEESAEYLAHKFALDTIKTFYNESYNYAIDCLKETIEYMESNEQRKETYIEHYNAYKKLYIEINNKKAIKPDNLR